jgi:hypothetical protein
MSSECLALVAAICLNQNASVEVVSDSIWGGARIAVDGTQITSIVRSDSGVFPDRRRMHRYCMAEKCLYYHVYCAQEGARYFCRISYNEAADRFSRRLEIYSPDQSHMAASLRRLRLAVAGDRYLFPLSGFRERSSAPYPPWCRPREDRGCR